MVRIFTVLLFFALIKLHPATAQVARVQCSFIADTVNTAYGQTFTNKAKFVNKTTQKITLTKGTIVGDNLLALPDTIKLAPGAERLIPVKFFAQASLFGSAELKVINIAYTDIEANLLVTTNFTAKLNQTDNVMVAANESLIYINPANAITPIKVHCYNKGYTQATVKIKLTANPFGLLITNPLTQVVLKAGEERIVELNVSVADLEKGAQEYNALIEATNAKGVQLSSSMVHLTVLQNNNRQNLASLPQANTLKNAFELSYLNLNNAFTYYQARVNGSIALSANSTLNYWGNVNYYDRLQKYEAYDSWVGFNTNRLSVKMGSIMENLDHPIYGRGIKASLAFNEHSSISTYYVDNSYTLISTLNNNVSSRGKIMAASYDYARNGYIYKTSVLAGNDLFTGTKMNMLTSYALLPIGAKQRLELKGGYSNELNSGNIKTGFAGGAVYSYRNSKLNINLNNYFSSAFYTGLQRGSTLMDNQVSLYLTPKTSLFVHYALLKNRPRYLTDSLNTYGLYNNTIKYEIGFDQRIGRLNVALHPYLLNQNTDQQYNVSGAQTSSSVRMGLDLNYSFKGGHQLFLLGDAGYTRSYTAHIPQNQYMGVKVNASYLHNWWGINMAFQRAPYYLSEEVLLRTPANKYFSYAVGPNMHLAGMKGKLNVTINPYLSFASYGIGQNRSLNAQATYKLKGNWQLSGDVFYTSINGAINNLRSRVGVSKQFTRQSIPGSKKLELTFFNDINNDGIQGQDENVLEGLIVSLRNNGQNDATDITTMSGTNGIVSYSNLKEGNYDIVVMKANGLHMAENVNIDMQKSKRLAIPMVKSIWLKGKIVPVKQEFATGKPLLEGLRIVAVGTTNKEYSTLTNEDGEFEFSLPANVYHVKVALNGQKYIIRNQDQEIAVNAQLHTQLEFLLVDETRQVIVKQF